MKNKEQLVSKMGIYCFIVLNIFMYSMLLALRIIELENGLQFAFSNYNPEVRGFILANIQSYDQVRIGYDLYKIEFISIVSLLLINMFNYLYLRVVVYKDEFKILLYILSTNLMFIILITVFTQVTLGKYYIVDMNLTVYFLTIFLGYYIGNSITQIIEKFYTNNK